MGSDCAEKEVAKWSGTLGCNGIEREEAALF